MKITKTILPPVLFLAGLVALSLGAPAGLLLIGAALLLCMPALLQPRLYAFPSNCNGRILTVGPSNGCSLTRASIRGMTPQDFEDQNNKEIGMDRVYAQSQEARAAGYVEGTLMMLLNSRMTNIKAYVNRTKVGLSQSVILPFITRRQRRSFQSNYWKVASGSANANAGAGGTHPGAWDLVIQNNPSAMGTTLTDLHRWFLAGKTLIVEYVGTNGVFYQNTYVILNASTVGGTCKVTVAPNVSANGWGAYTAAQKLVFQIGGAGGGNAEAGTIAQVGANSVSDYESWQGQDPAINNLSLLNYWPQTMRRVHEYTDEYLKALTAPMTSEFWKQFKQLPMAEQLRQQKAEFDKNMLTTCFYGNVINEFQTVETYTSLPQVVDPANPDCVLEYKANAIGFFNQLRACGRYADLAGGALNLDSLAQTGYQLKRAREADGTSVDRIEWGTDRFTAGLIRDLMIKFFKEKYGVVTHRNYQPGQELKFDNQVMLNYDLYQLPPELGGYDLVIWHHKFFDDKLSATATTSGVGDNSTNNVGRTLLGLDWSDLEIGIAGTSSVKRITNQNDELYRHIIKLNLRYTTLDSMTFCPIIEDSNRHYFYNNFSTAAPTITVAPGQTLQ